MSAIRWSIHGAAQEFDIHRETLGKKLLAQGIKPGDDDKYSTSDICKAVYGDLDGEELLLTRAKRIKLDRDNAIGDRQVAMIDLVERVWSKVAVEYRQRVTTADISQELKEHLLETLTEPKIDEYFEATVKELEGGADEGAAALESAPG